MNLLQEKSVESENHNGISVSKMAALGAVISGSSSFCVEVILDTMINCNVSSKY